MLEVEAHSQLRQILKQTETREWIHHLTMTRLVARGLRLKKSTLIQTSTIPSVYSLSYLTPALLFNQSAIIVTSTSRQQQLINHIIPSLTKQLNNQKIIQTDLTKDLSFTNKIAIVTPPVWLADKFSFNYSQKNLVIIEECQHLPDFVIDYLTIKILPSDWYQIQLDNPQSQDTIREYLAKLTQSIFSHPINPYNSYLLTDREEKIIQQLNLLINPETNTSDQKIAQFSNLLSQSNSYFSYVEIDRQKGNFILKMSPLEIENKIKSKWEQQPLILLSNYLSPEKEPRDYSQFLGLEINDFTCLKFSPHAQNQNLNLYLPDNLPLPNNPQFQTHLNQEILALVGAIKVNHSPVIILVEDYPLQNQITANLASQFGSRVKLNKTKLGQNNILVCNSKFWLEHRLNLPIPQLLVMTTLPIPSLENPLISAQVNYYKKQKKDWFRLFLLPTAVKIIQQTTISIRQNQGIFALLDNRVNLRGYGKNIREILEPYDKINYLDLNWLNE